MPERLMFSSPNMQMYACKNFCSVKLSRCCHLGLPETLRCIPMRILLVGDVHVAMDEIHKLNLWIDQNKKPDLMLVNGDLTSVFHGEPDQPDLNAQIDTFRSVLEKLQQSGIPILYVPGNHDPSSEFEDPIKLSNVTNIHSKWVELSNFD